MLTETASHKYGRVGISSQLKMRTTILLFLLFPLLGWCHTALTVNDLSDKVKLDKVLKGLKKIYSGGGDKDRAALASEAIGKDENVKKQTLIALINKSMNEIGTKEHSAHHMINLHTLHQAESLLKEPASKNVHAKYHEHALPFQSDTWVRGFVFGSLGVVFAVAAYQGVLTAKKFV